MNEQYYQNPADLVVGRSCSRISMVNNLQIPCLDTAYPFDKSSPDPYTTYFIKILHSIATIIPGF